MLLRAEDVSLTENTASLSEKIVQRLDQIVCSLTTTEPDEGRTSSLRRLLIRAIYLARILRVQHAQYAVEIPGHEFDPSSMEDIGAIDEEDISLSPVACVLAPAVYKYQHGKEENTKLSRRVIFKAKVLVMTK